MRANEAASVRRPGRGFTSLIGAGAMLAAMSAIGQGGAGGDADKRQIVEQKAQLVQRILADSPASARIEGSGNQEARAHLAEARAKYALGNDLFARGEIGASEGAFNDAMWLIGKARQLVPSTARRTVEHRTRYQQLTSSVETMLGAAQRHLGRAGGTRGSPAGVDIEQAIRLFEEAKALAGAERFEDANRNLLGAERALVSGLRLVLGNATLDYTPRFDTLTDEWNFEADRFASLQQLVPLALSELKPAREAQQEVDRHVRRGLGLREAAGREAARREWEAALKSVREASEWMQRALLAAGLVTPKQ